MRWYIGRKLSFLASKKEKSGFEDASPSMLEESLYGTCETERAED
jgi:hypothetical protein